MIVIFYGSRTTNNSQIAIDDYSTCITIFTCKSQIAQYWTNIFVSHDDISCSPLKFEHVMVYNAAILLRMLQLAQYW
jgi:hypothetical protein